MSTAGDARRLRNGEDIRDAILSALADGPLSSREILIRIDGQTHTGRRALKALLSSGQIARHGCRVTFDFGNETLFQIPPIRTPGKDAPPNV